ncbi:MAG: hypothetical protein K8R77_08195 [Anaerolineaceae bacterium]|nr:hypothetical protein [Anaerolineaceae bacterium]
MKNGEQRLTPLGTIVKDSFPVLERTGALTLYAWRIDPHHLHCLLFQYDACLKELRTLPFWIPQPISEVIRVFKSRSTRKINALLGIKGIPFWRRKYYIAYICDLQQLRSINHDY